MKTNNNVLKQSLIHVQKELILQDIQDDKNRNSNNKFLYKNQTSKRNKDEKILRKAYKNVINVITNLLDNIEDEQVNGKINAIGTQRIMEKNIKPKIKMPIKKRESYDISGNNYKLHKLSKPENILEPMNTNTLSMAKSNLKLSLNWKSRKLTVNENNIYFPDGSLSNMNSSNLSSSRSRNNQTLVKKINKKFGNRKHTKSFFTPKNSLSIKTNFNKTYINNLKKPIHQKPSLELNNQSFNKYASSLSSHSKSSNIKSSIVLKSSKGNSKSLMEDEDTSSIPIYSFNSNEIMITKEEDSKNLETILPFSRIKEKIIDTDTERGISSHFELNNNQNNLEISLTDDLLHTKKKTKVKKLSLENNDDNYNNTIIKSINLKNIKNNIIKTNYKEKKYRCLLCKGYVYDSLDDEEESDEEDINNCYFEPNSIFLYILDTMTLINSFIVLFYLPIYLAKRVFFCKDISDKNNIILYFIDFIYILDFIINFYRAYYNFDEVLIKKNIKIFIHYFKTWLLFDLISSIPIFTILKNYESTCISGGNKYNDFKLNNSGMHSRYYNINLNNMHYILLLIKVVKTLKIFKKNIAVNKIKQFFYRMDLLNNWGDVLLYALFFFSFLNFISCIFIFLGRNIDDSWIFLNGLDKMSFIDIYIGGIYYIVMTVTTVGYGDILGKSKIEIMFQIVMIIVGTCIYSWLISSVSNYVKKRNEKYVKYEEKLAILEKIKLSTHINEKLYNKILRLLNYRKYREEETEKNVLLESLPNSLKNALLIEMYKIYINGFIFFKGIENREFIVQIISKLNPIIGIRGDILIEGGEVIEEIIFIKNGVLSLEIWIDMDNPEESIKNYLGENGFINLKKSSTLNKSLSKYNSTLSITNRNQNLNTTFNNYFEKIDNQNEKALIENKKKLKILDIRKNEHFGDVYMFLNKKSPFYIRVKSKVADLLIIKKIDALNISDRYPDIWKLVIKKPLENSKTIDNLTLKTLTSFCNLNGIKTKLFRKKNKNNQYPRYYLNPIINKTIKKKKNKNDMSASEKSGRKNNYFDRTEKENDQKIKINPLEVIDSEEKSKKCSKTNSSFSFFDKNKSGSSLFKNIHKNKESKKSTYYKGYKISILQADEKKDINSDNSDINSNNNKEKPSDTNTDNNSSNFDFVVNDEISPGENFSIKLYDNDKPNFINNINKLQKIIPDNIYINNLNINYLNAGPEKNKDNSKELEKKFDFLKISNSTSIEINSSYENINEITLNKYISYYEFRKETKEFLIEKAKQYDSKMNFTKLIQSKPLENKFFPKDKNRRIYESSINNNIFLKNKKRFLENKDKLVIRKTSTNKINAHGSYEALNNLQGLTKNDKYNNKKLNKRVSSNAIDNNLLKLNEDKDDSININDLNFYKKKFLKSIDNNNNSIKKRKKLNELDIITSNIQKTSLNLNQPEAFYAGLFNNIINKDYLQLKEPKIIFNSKRSFNNNIAENLIKKVGKEI